MENKKLFPVWVIWLAWVLGPLLQGQPVTVTKAPPALESLAARWTWAMENTDRLKEKTGFYIAYSIQRHMGENSFIHCGSDENTAEKTLYEIVYGKKPPEATFSLKGKSVSAVARQVLDQAKKQHLPEKKVLKEVAILFRFEREAKTPFSCGEITVGNMELPVKLDRGPLYWLGQAENRQSIELLETLFNNLDNTASGKIKERIVMALGIHDAASGAIGFLKKVLKGNYPDDLREKAAFWMGEQPQVEAVEILAAAAVKDSSLEVRKKAVFGLYRLELNEADKALIHLAQQGKEQEVRKKAIFWLGQKAVKRTAEVLTDVVNQDKDVEIQEAAVFALSQLPGAGGVSPLITIAKTHKSMAIRKKAIFWLSQCEDPRALNTIIEIINR